MSEDSNSKPYLFFSLDGQDQVISHSSMATLNRIADFAEAGKLGLASEGSDSSSQDPSASPHSDGKISHSLHEDVEMKSSGSSGSGTESQSNESHGNESHRNESNGNESSGRSNSNSKDSALLESSGSNKSSNSHSPSPPSSSNAYSLLSASSEQDNPSTSGCSSEESAKAKTQKELIKTLKELKLHLPADKRNKGSKSTTLNTLKYALRCVKQVKANEEYYQMLMINDSQPSGLDVSSYTMEEIDSITSEYTLKNPDMFAVAVSLVTGKIVYISDQAASILNCKREVFKNSKFVEFLTPQDVSVFYSFTTPYRLPSWSMCTGADASPSECIQEKSFFCRISSGRERKGNLQYYPFRMTPYLMKVQDTENAEDQLCCLLLAERVHSGFEAPRIPTDKRVFTTTHTPNCVFQEVDERAVPLLGYLPQDLIGTPVLLHLHPNDRPIMLGIHKKILQYAGQPFEHSSIRFCARNGEYITMDTSWSSFVNPWSRKVSFVIARHKVRMGPVNEDVFAAPATGEGKAMDSDVLEITEQIHRLLLQPVHNNSSSGYGSLGSNDHLVSVPSSSESIGNGARSRTEEEEGKSKAKTFQEICKVVHMQRNQGQQCRKSLGTQLTQKCPVVGPKDSAYPVNSRDTVEDQQVPVQEELAFKDQTVYSYQQISCLDSVIRYLESCNVPITVKRKCQSSSNTTSSNSDEDKQKAAESSVQVAEGSGHLKSQAGLLPLDVSEKPSGSGVASTSLTPLALPSKSESVVSITSQCSYSSTIVHVGDKKPQPESEIIKDGPGAGDTALGPAPSVPPASLSPPSQEREAYKKLGLTKQVLAAHTQKEEQAFLHRFRELRGVHAFKADSRYLERKKGQAVAHAGPSRDGKQRGTEEPCRGGRNKKSKSKRVKQNEPSDSTELHRKQLFRQELQGLNRTSWSLSDASLSGFPVQFPAVMPAYPLQVYPGSSAMPPNVDTVPLPGFRDSQCSQDRRFSTQPMQPQFPAPLVTPVVALVLPNYMPQQLRSAPHQPFYPEQNLFQSPQACISPHTTMFPVQTPFTTQNPFPAPPFPFIVPDKQPKPADPEIKEGPSRSCTPQSVGRQDPSSPPLFQSRCSSPLQLNLLQLEESQRSSERQYIVAPSSGPYGSTAAEKGANTGIQAEVNKQQDNAGELHHCDVLSSSSDLLDILMQDDSRSVTGSATSGSMGSASNGCGTSACGSGESASRTGSSHNSSNYFGSVDSSQDSHKIKKPGRGVSGQMGVQQGESLIQCVLQDALWLLSANVDKTVMMTYQLPSRDIQQVLLEDSEKLKQMQKNQPHFSDKQIKELAKVHPWIKEGGLPKAINVEACIGCKEASVEEELSDLHMGKAKVSYVTVHPSAQSH